MWLPLLGLILGVLIGLQAPIQIPIQYATYMAVGILAAIDSVFGGVRSAVEGKYDNGVFTTGFFANTLLAVALTYLGVKLGVDLVLGATVAFSIRIFTNLGIIRRHLLEQWRSRRAQRAGHPRA